ncbi:MAG TPA: ABC transporter substrate-binding protein, partial [Anaerolineales bacterium]|nr:ABC transporter substrate-binding protein [Anaerolineales bacterium]
MKRTFTTLIFIVLTAVSLSACDPDGGPGPRETDAGDGRTQAPSAQAPSAEPPTPLPTPTPDPRSGRTLVVCIGEEPASLFPFGNPSDAARSVLQAVYDGPVDRLDFAHQPVILSKLPSLSDGDAAVQPVPVAVGDGVLAADGSPVTLTPGLVVRPAGCYSDACAVAYDGSEGFSMDQISASFQLLEGLAWSDGSPLTAADSIYAFNLARAPETSGSKFKTDRTQNYQQTDDLTVEWRGLPGFMDPAYMTNFWTPLPEHAWGSIPPADLPGSEMASRSPLSYGPYTVEEWSPGDYIQLRWNEHYFRAAEGLPKFENLIFRFLQTEPEDSVDQLLSGECDILDRTLRLDEAAPGLQDLAGEGRVDFSVESNLDWEQVTFGILPASFDDGFNGLVDRPNYFGDPRTRRAIAMCMDREAVLEEVLQGASAI